MIQARYVLAGALALGAVVTPMLSALQNQSQDDSSAASTPKRRAAHQNAASAEDDGQRVFEQHCSRCHTAPDGFSPRISGTVVRHMRVRASLSQHEEEELLHFFNP